MPKLVVFVLDDPDKLADIMAVWQAHGVPGVTSLETSGLGRIAALGAADDLPIFPSLRELLEPRTTPSRTLFSVVDDDLDLDALLAATERVVGNLDEPHTGIMFAVPVLMLRGLGRPKAKG